MTYKILKNKKYHIPTALLKEVEKNANEQEELEARINAMTDEEFEAYEAAIFEEAEREYERGEIFTEEYVERMLEEDMIAIDKEYANYMKWKKLLEAKSKGVKLRNII